MELKKLAQVIRLTKRIKEKSYNSVSMEYKKSNMEAYLKAVKKLNLDKSDYIIVYILIVNNLNESIDWANAYIEKYSN